MASDPTQISVAELNALDPATKAQVKAMFNLRQALFDILGAYPQDNVFPYFYAFSNTVRQGNAIAAGATIQNTIKVTADAAFVANSIRAKSTGDFLVFFRMDDSDRQLMNQAIHSQTIAGTGQRPAPLHKPLLINANTTISYDVTDISGLQNEVYWTLGGFKVYNRKVQ